MTGIKKPTLVTVPEGATELDVLAERYRAAFTKMQIGREQWIEATLELASVVAEARKKLLDHREYSRWLERNELQPLRPNDRIALCGFAKDLSAARKLLETAMGTSWQWIWENRPNKPQRTPTRPGKGTLQPDRSRNRRKHITGSQHRNQVPDVMRDDPPPPPKPTKQLSEMFLTPEQVDPDFKGTPLQFTTKYGHVLLHTKEQIEQHKRQDALMAWLGMMADLERVARTMLSAFANVDPSALAEWISKPSKAEKLCAWCDSIQVACEAISKLSATVPRPASRDRP
jgi:hypothetical protein